MKFKNLRSSIVLSTASLLFSGLALSSTSFAAAPSDQSIQQLFKVMNLEQLTQETMLQLKPQLANQATQMVSMITHHSELNAKEQKVAQQVTEKLYSKTSEMVSWKYLQPIYTQVYKEAYSQEEVQAQIDFYATPIGQSILKKTPIVAQKTMALMSDGIQKAALTQAQDMQTILNQLHE